MDLLAVSPESIYTNEAQRVVELLEAGLDRYHLRKPGWTSTECAQFLAEIPDSWHTAISIHQCYELAKEFDVKIHKRDNTAPLLSKATSRSLHQLDDLHNAISGYEYVFLSPVFQSISKIGYGPQWTEETLRTMLSQTRTVKLYALGGVTPQNVAQAPRLGFDGVVVHGALWQAPDPLSVFHTFKEEIA